MAKINFSSMGLKPILNLQNLVVGEHNKFAVSACEAVAESPGEAYNPLYIFGPPGIGKTHLAQAIAQKMLDNNPDTKILYVTAERLMSDVIAAVSEDRVMEVRTRLSGMDLLIIDDIQYLSESKIAQEELIHVFNNMNTENHQTIFVSNQAPNQLKNFSERLRSRFEGGLAAASQMPDLENRVAILKSKQALQKIEIPDNLLLFVAQRLKTSVRQLEGFLKRMHAYVHLSHQKVSEELVRSVIREILPEDEEDSSAELLLKEPEGIKSAPAPQAHPAPTPEPKAAPVPEPKAAAPPAAPVPPPAPEPPPEPEPVPVPKSVAAPEASPEPAAPDPVPVQIEEKAEDENPAIDRFGSGSNGNGASSHGNGISLPPKEDAPAAPVEQTPEPVAAAEIPVEVSATEDAPPAAEEPLPKGFKEISAVFFYPQRHDAEFQDVYAKFKDVIKKHKLKFRLKCVKGHEYETSKKVDYTKFVDVCKENKVPVAIVIGPPPDASVAEQDFYDLLTVTLDVQGISLQIINWSEIRKDYRYLNLSLDIALVKTR